MHRQKCFAHTLHPVELQTEMTRVHENVFHFYQKKYALQFQKLFFFNQKKECFS